MLVRDILNLIKNQKRLILSISTDTGVKTEASISNMNEIITLYGDKIIKHINISTCFDPDIDIPENPRPVLNIVIGETSTNEDKEKNIVDELYDRVVKATNLPLGLLGNEKHTKAFISAIVDIAKEANSK